MMVKQESRHSIGADLDAVWRTDPPRADSNGLYVAEWSNGVVKVGASHATAHRRETLRYCLPLGWRIARFEVVPVERERVFIAERWLISRMRRIGVLHAGREWFSGVKFGAALTLAKQAAARRPAPETLLECIAQCIYQRGLVGVAKAMRICPGNLSVMLVGDGRRHFGVDELERYIELTGDTAPISYLIAHYLGDEAAGLQCTGKGRR